MSNYRARVFVIQTPSSTDALDAGGSVLAYIAPPEYVYDEQNLPTEAQMQLWQWTRFAGALSDLSSDCSVIVISTQPVLVIETPDWSITQPGTSTKELEEDQFILADGVTYTTQVFLIANGTQTSLPGWLSFSAGSKTFTRNIPAGFADTTVTIRVVVSDPSGNTAQDEFQIVVHLAAIPENLTEYTDGPDYEVAGGPVAADMLIKLDFNACDAIGGWVINKNNKTSPAQVDIMVDGVLRTTLTANVERADVRNALITSGVLPAGTTFATYGFLYTKDTTYATGTPHTWRVFGHDTTIESITDTNAPATITCGTVTATPSIAQVGRKVNGGTIYHYVKVANYEPNTTLVYGRTRRKVGSTQDAWSAWFALATIADNSFLTDATAVSQGYQLGSAAIYTNSSLANDYTLNLEFSMSATGENPVAVTYYFPAVGEQTTNEVPTPEAFHQIYSV